MKDQAETNCFHIQFASFVCNSFQIWQTLPQVSGNLCSVQNIRRQFKANTLLQRTDRFQGICAQFRTSENSLKQTLCYRELIPDMAMDDVAYNTLSGLQIASTVFNIKECKWCLITDLSEHQEGFRTRLLYQSVCKSYRLVLYMGILYSALFMLLNSCFLFLQINELKIIQAW